MKVADLEPGCLVKPKDPFIIRVQPLYEPTGNLHKLGVDELKSMGFYHHATMSKLNGKMGRVGAFGSETVAIYTGAIRLKGTYFGVKKQHTFILRDTPIIMDGYEVKGLEKIQ